MLAWVPWSSGAYWSDSESSTSAWPSSASLMLSIEPAETPATLTGFPFTSWLAFWNLAVTV